MRGGDWSKPAACELSSHPQSLLRDDEICRDISCSNPGEALFCFSCWGLRASCQGERPVNQTVSLAADKVIRPHVTFHVPASAFYNSFGMFTSSQTLKAIHVIQLALPTVLVFKKAYTLRTFTHILTNMWITALNEIPQLYFSLPIKADLFLHVSEPLSTPNVWHLHNGLSAVFCGQPMEDFRPTFPADHPCAKAFSMQQCKMLLHYSWQI